MSLTRIWLRAVRGKQIEAAWKKVHTIYGAIHASARGGAKYLLSHDRCLVCILRATSPSSFQKLSSVSGLRGEASDLFLFFLALLICHCHVKHF